MDPQRTKKTRKRPRRRESRDGGGGGKTKSQSSDTSCVLLFAEMPMAKKSDAKVPPNERRIPTPTTAMKRPLAAPSSSSTSSLAIDMYDASSLSADHRRTRRRIRQKMTTTTRFSQHMRCFILLVLLLLLGAASAAAAKVYIPGKEDTQLGKGNVVLSRFTRRDDIRHIRRLIVGENGGEEEEEADPKSSDPSDGALANRRHQRQQRNRELGSSRSHSHKKKQKKPDLFHGGGYYQPVIIQPAAHMLPGKGQYPRRPRPPPPPPPPPSPPPFNRYKYCVNLSRRLCSKCTQDFHRLVKRRRCNPKKKCRKKKNCCKTKFKNCLFDKKKIWSEYFHNECDKRLTVDHTVKNIYQRRRGRRGRKKKKKKKPFDYRKMLLRDWCPLPKLKRPDKCPEEVQYFAELEVEIDIYCPFNEQGLPEQPEIEKKRMEAGFLRFFNGESACENDDPCEQIIYETSTIQEIIVGTDCDDEYRAAGIPLPPDDDDAARALETSYDGTYDSFNDIMHRSLKRKKKTRMKKRSSGKCRGKCNRKKKRRRLLKASFNNEAGAMTLDDGMGKVRTFSLRTSNNGQQKQDKEHNQDEDQESAIAEFQHQRNLQVNTNVNIGDLTPAECAELSIEKEIKKQNPVAFRDVDRSPAIEISFRENINCDLGAQDCSSVEGEYVCCGVGGDIGFPNRDGCLCEIASETRCEAGTTFTDGSVEECYINANGVPGDIASRTDNLCCELRIGPPIEYRYNCSASVCGPLPTASCQPQTWISEITQSAPSAQRGTYTTTATFEIVGICAAALSNRNSVQNTVHSTIQQYVTDLIRHCGCESDVTVSNVQIALDTSKCPGANSRLGSSRDLQDTGTTCIDPSSGQQLSSVTVNTSIQGGFSNGLRPNRFPVDDIVYDDDFNAPPNPAPGPGNNNECLCKNLICKTFRKALSDTAGSNVKNAVISSESTIFSVFTPLPTSSPTKAPTTHPSARPSSSPTSTPSTYPTGSPSAPPSARPSSSPTNGPTRKPSSSPSGSPTSSPSSSLTGSPSEVPSESPTGIPSATPSSRPSSSPSSGPSAHPSSSPSRVPSSRPSLSPSALPSSLPTTAPSIIPSESPSDSPSESPSSDPSDSPSESPSEIPSQAPSNLSSSFPSSSPSDGPSESPSDGPSQSPSDMPSQSPSISPSDLPSSQPSSLPTSLPSTYPSNSPSISSAPSQKPSSDPSKSSSPSEVPSKLPSPSPSDEPSYQPSISPSNMPSLSPSILPSSAPSNSPSEVPSKLPSTSPSDEPSYQPSISPSNMPSLSPSALPSNMPSLSPSSLPSSAPSNSPSEVPSKLPSLSPSDEPSYQPSISPSNMPSLSPSALPSSAPSNNPSDSPSESPSEIPSQAPSNLPSSFPSSSPSDGPSESPSDGPSQSPSDMPSQSPSISPSDTPSNSPSSQPSSLPSSMPTSICDIMVDISQNSSSVDLSDDEYVEVALGGNFSFYGIEYTNVSVTSNGYVSFGDGNGTCEDCFEYSGDEFPTTDTPNNIIAPLWYDLDPEYGGMIRYKYTMTTPDSFTTQWFEVPEYVGNIDDDDVVGAINTFQATLFFKTDCIQFKYDLLNISNTANTPPFIGAENIDGTEGVNINTTDILAGTTTCVVLCGNPLEVVDPIN